MKHLVAEHLKATIKTETNQEPIFDDKEIGFQLGFQVTFAGQKFWAKTHQNGSRKKSGSSSGTNEAKEVDVNELLIYKLFEYLELGPQVEFVINPAARGGVIILSKDLGD